jgi:hypothetical protein
MRDLLLHDAITWNLVPRIGPDATYRSKISGSCSAFRSQEPGAQSCLARLRHLKLGIVSIGRQSDASFLILGSPVCFCD